MLKIWAVPTPGTGYPDHKQPREGVAQCSCLYAILSHRFRLALVLPVRNRFALLSEISPNGVLRD